MCTLWKKKKRCPFSSFLLFRSPELNKASTRCTTALLASFICVLSYAYSFLFQIMLTVLAICYLVSSECQTFVWDWRRDVIHILNTGHICISMNVFIDVCLIINAEHKRWNSNIHFISKQYGMFYSLEFYHYHYLNLVHKMRLAIEQALQNALWKVQKLDVN